MKPELLNIYLMFTSSQFLRGSGGQRFISCLGLRSMEMTVWEGRWTKNDTGEAEDPYQRGLSMRQRNTEPCEGPRERVPNPILEGGRPFSSTF